MPRERCQSMKTTNSVVFCSVHGVSYQHQWFTLMNDIYIHVYLNSKTEEDHFRQNNYVIIFQRKTSASVDLVQI
jgi:hypothetical protein